MVRFKTTRLNNKTMTEIFITDIQNKVQADDILNFFKTENSELKISYDLNETEKSYPVDTLF